jgi:hypothetical protein
MSHTTTLDMLVLKSDHPFGPTFLPQLDECLASARPHAGESKLDRGDLIEIAGPSGSGMICSPRLMLEE